MSRDSTLVRALALIDESNADITAWSGKPRKSSKRVFAYVGGRRGRWVVKASVGSDAFLKHEHETLETLGRRFHGTPLGASMPSSLYDEDVLVLPFVEGVSLRDVANRNQGASRLPADLLEACLATMDWLRAFHAATAAGEGKGGTHGDFKPTNVLLAPAVRVIDWEWFEHEGTQNHDLMHFLLYTGLTVYAPDRVAGFRGTFIERTWMSELTRVCLERYGYVSRLGLAADLLAYVTAVMARRAALGLDNRGYFLESLLARLQHLCATGARLPVDPS